MSDPNARGDAVRRASEWVYTGVWAGLVKYFRVPPKPPTLPVRPGEALEAFQPAEGFLRYLKLWFWLVAIPIDLVILGVWLAVTVASPVLGLVFFPVAFFLAVVPDVLFYIGIHLRYDTTWYVMSDRSIRIRRGIWVITETTITFENIQNLKIASGPVERAYGIGRLVLETAGGGGSPEQGRTQAHVGVIEGVSDAERLRDIILPRIRDSKSAGLGDEEPDEPGPFGPAHLAGLREIRDALRA